MASNKPQQAAAAATPARQLLHPAANIQRFELRQGQAIQYMVRVRALMLGARDHLKAHYGEDGDEDLLALLDMAAESAMDAIEEMPPLSVLTDDEGGAT